MFARDMVIATRADAYGLHDQRVDIPRRWVASSSIHDDVAQPFFRLAVPAYHAPGEAALAGPGGRRPERLLTRQMGSARGPHADAIQVGGRGASAASHAHVQQALSAISSGALVLAILLAVTIATAIDITAQAEGRVALGVTAAALLGAMISREY